MTRAINVLVIVALIAPSMAIEPAQAEGVLLAQDEVAYTWDDNGDLLSDGVRTFEYDYANRLTGW